MAIVARGRKSRFSDTFPVHFERTFIARRRVCRPSPNECQRLQLTKSGASRLPGFAARFSRSRINFRRQPDAERLHHGEHSLQRRIAVSAE